MPSNINKNFIFATLLIFANLFYQQPIQAHPLSPQSMSGWYNSFLDEKKYLSPFNGFIWSETGFLEKLYRFGNVQTIEKKRNAGEGSYTIAQSGDATILLVYELFHDVMGVLHPVDEKTHCAAYLTPKLIGRLFNGLEKQRILVQFALEKITENKKDFPKEYSEIFGIFKKVKGKTQEKKFQAIEQSTELYKKLLTNSVAILIKKSLKKNLKNEKPSTRKEVLTSCAKFSALLVESLQESGYFLNTAAQYPAYTPYFILLSFMHRKADSANNFESYVNEFQPPVIQNNWQDILKAQSSEFHQDPDIFDKKFRVHATDDKKKNFIMENFEEICLTEIFNQFYKKPIPRLHDEHTGVKLNKVSFRDCSELAIYNFVRLILAKLGLYNAQQGSYNVTHIPQALYQWLVNKNVEVNKNKLEKKLAPLLNFFHQFNSPELMESKDCHQAWASFISNRKGVKYSLCVKNDGTGHEVDTKDYARPFIYARGGVNHGNPETYRSCSDDGSVYLCELAGYATNFVALVRATLGIECLNFKELCDLFDLDLVEGSLYDFADDHLHEIKSQVMCRFKTLIDKKAVDIIIRISRGHSAVLDMDSSVQRYQTDIMRFSLKHLADDCAFTNLSALYSRFDAMKENLQLEAGLPSAIYLHAWFMQNLIEKKGFCHALSFLMDEAFTSDSYLYKFAEKQFNLYLNQSNSNIFDLFEILCEHEKPSKYAIEWVLKLYKIVLERKLDTSNKSGELLLKFRVRWCSKYADLIDFQNKIDDCIVKSRQDFTDQQNAEKCMEILNSFYKRDFLTAEQAVQQLISLLQKMISNFHEGLFLACKYQIAGRENLYFYPHLKDQIKEAIARSHIEHNISLFSEILFYLDPYYRDEKNCYSYPLEIAQLILDTYFSDGWMNSLELSKKQIESYLNCCERLASILLLSSIESILKELMFQQIFTAVLDKLFENKKKLIDITKNKEYIDRVEEAILDKIQQHQDTNDAN